MLGPTFRRDPSKRAIIDDWVAQLKRNDREGIKQAVLGVANRRGVLDEIPSITAPTLVIVGADDRPTPVQRSAQIVALIPGARLEIVPDAGHSSSVEQPEAITALLKQFLADVDAPLASPASD